MSRLTQRHRLYRILDANINRSMEGLRVCEDICRFVHDDKRLARRGKDLRHALQEAIRDVDKKILTRARNVGKDVGRGTTVRESLRKNCDDVALANFQRVKEALRVLEETFKLVNVKAAEAIKKIRYRSYNFERDYIQKFVS